jgi:uncharacterized protein
MEEPTVTHDAEATYHPTSNPPATIAEPTLVKDREQTVDVIRGLALLGILAMNIIAFAFPSEAYQDPMGAGITPWTGPFEGANAASWWSVHLLADQKMMGLFSMLFGAGVVLMDRGRPEGFAGVYYRRMGFLFVVGLIHAFGIWFGDILLSYSLCGLLLYPARRLSTGWLFALGTAVFTMGLIVSLGLGALMQMAPPEEMAKGMPTPEAIATSVEEVRSGWGGSLKYNLKNALFLQFGLFFIWTLWRGLGLMLIGMALMKLGFFAGRWSVRAYALTAVLGYGLGYAIIVPAAMRLVEVKFGLVALFSFPGQANYVGSVGVALAHASVLMLVVKAGAFRFLTDRLAAVGRMAFTNYLATSVVMTFCFYGWGLGLFAKFERAEVYWFVLGMWALMLLWSPFWLSRFRMGPLEWFWRSTTHLEWQAMRRA